MIAVGGQQLAEAMQRVRVFGIDLEDLPGRSGERCLGKRAVSGSAEYPTSPGPIRT